MAYNTHICFVFTAFLSRYDKTKTLNSNSIVENESETDFIYGHDGPLYSAYFCPIRPSKFYFWEHVYAINIQIALGNSGVGRNANLCKDDMMVNQDIKATCEYDNTKKVIVVKLLKFLL